MTSVTLTTNAVNLARAMGQAPGLLQRNLQAAMPVVLKLFSREARRNAPKGFSTLTQSISERVISPFEGEVFVGVDYGRAVEEGTGIYGPNRTASGRMPPQDNILDWVKLRNIQPNDAEMTQEDLAFLISRSIATKGTPAQPYLGPARKSQAAAASARINAAIEKTLAQVAG